MMKILSKAAKNTRIRLKILKKENILMNTEWNILLADYKKCLNVKLFSNVIIIFDDIRLMENKLFSLIFHALRLDCGVNNWFFCFKCVMTKGCHILLRVWLWKICLIFCHICGKSQVFRLLSISWKNERQIGSKPSDKIH